MSSKQRSVLESQTLGGMTFRKISSGTTTCTSASTTTLGTFTRVAGETVHLFAFPQSDAVAAIWTYDVSASSSMAIQYVRTTNANEFVVKIANTTGANRDVDWVLVGIR